MIDHTIRFEIPGVPVAKGRPKFARQGAFVRAYTPERTQRYETLVAHEAALAFKGQDPTERPIKLEIHLTLPIPASWTKKKQDAAILGEIVPTKKPDADNVLKGIKDAMNGIAYRDDSQVVNIELSKRYGLNPCAVVSVHVLGLKSA